MCRDDPILTIKSTVWFRAVVRRKRRRKGMRALFAGEIVPNRKFNVVFPEFSSFSVFLDTFSREKRLLPDRTRRFPRENKLVRPGWIQFRCFFVDSDAKPNNFSGKTVPFPGTNFFSPGNHALLSWRGRFPREKFLSPTGLDDFPREKSWVTASLLFPVLRCCVPNLPSSSRHSFPAPNQKCSSTPAATCESNNFCRNAPGRSNPSNSEPSCS